MGRGEASIGRTTRGWMSKVASSARRGVESVLRCDRCPSCLPAPIARIAGSYVTCPLAKFEVTGPGASPFPPLPAAAWALSTLPATLAISRAWSSSSLVLSPPTRSSHSLSPLRGRPRAPQTLRAWYPPPVACTTSYSTCDDESAHVRGVNNILSREAIVEGKRKREEECRRGREGGERDDTHSLMLRQTPESSLEQYSGIVNEDYHHRALAQRQLRVSEEDKGTYHLSHLIRLSDRPI